MLKLQLERDKARMLRRMKCLEWDRITSELPAWWNRMREENSSQLGEQYNNNHTNLSVTSPGEENDYQSLLHTSNGEMGARNPSNQPPDGLFSHDDDVTRTILVGCGGEASHQQTS